MRGIGHTLSRLPAAQAFIAGAAILAGALAQETAQAEEPAAQMSRASGDVAFPRPLDPVDVARVRHIFSLQARGSIDDVEREIPRLNSPLLLGHILAQRYLGQFHKTTNVELASWIAAYADHPDSAAAQALLRRRQQGGGERSAFAQAVPRPFFSDRDGSLPDQSELVAPGVLRNPALDRTLASFARDGEVARATRLLSRTKGLDAAYDSVLRAELAQIVFTQNRDAEALRIAAHAFQLGTKDGGRVGLAGYIGGLAAWRLGQVDVALPLFEAAADAGIAPPSLRAAAAFWAARAHLRMGDDDGYLTWLARAAAAPRSFYGMLGRQTLELSGGFSWSQERLSRAAIDAVAATPQGWRAFALLQVGESARAEAELDLLRPIAASDQDFGRALLQVAGAAGMIDLATELAGTVPTEDGRPRDVLRFHVPQLHPRDGFHVDPALIYALTRLESNFDPAAVSPMGARGLMQIMPVTAGYISADPGFARHGSARLRDASLNLELGQRYVSYLARQDVVSGDLIRLLASYNAGPGSLQRWTGDIRDGGDPLMFIEAIPAAETRHFVQRVLAYTWLYAARLLLPAPSLDELASGAFPRFSERGSSITLSATATTLH